MRMMFLIAVTSWGMIYMFNTLSRNPAKPVKIISDEQTQKLKKLLQR
jgi:hypothetical protein